MGALETLWKLADDFEIKPERLAESAELSAMISKNTAYAELSAWVKKNLGSFKTAKKSSK